MLEFSKHILHSFCLLLTCSFPYRSTVHLKIKNFLINTTFYLFKLRTYTVCITKNHKNCRAENYRFSLIIHALKISSKAIQANNTPIPCKTSSWKKDHPFFITFLMDSIASVNGRHLENIRSPLGIASVGQTNPALQNLNSTSFCYRY